MHTVLSPRRSNLTRTATLAKSLLCVLATLPAAYAAPLVLGDTTSGDTPGTNAIDIQTARDSGQSWQAATGSTSIAFGTANSASGSRTMSLGQHNEATNDLSMSIGAFNVSDGFGMALGYSNTISYSSDAYSFDGPSLLLGCANSVSGFSSYGIGGYNALGSESAVLGSFNNLANGSRSHALGIGNQLYYAVDSVAVGNDNTINSSDSTVLGANNTTYSANATVVGNNNSAYETNTSIFGSGISNGTIGSIMIGSSDAAKVTILSDGKVGIGLGANSPTEKLHVGGNIKVTGNLVTSSGTLSLPASGTLLATSGSGSTTRLAVGGTTALNSSWGGSTAIGADGQNKVVAGYLGASTNGAVIGSHNSALTAWTDLNLIGQNLIFRAGGEVERMRINNVGNVGINTSSPLQKLQISGSGQGTQGILLEDTSQAAGNKLWITQLRTGPSTYQIAPANDSGYANMAGFVMDRSGNVGIGTTAPGAKLVVQGNGAPVSSAATPNGLLILSGQGTTNTVLTAGVDNTGGNAHGWLQARHATSGPSYYPIALNPSGGNVGIGTGTAVPAAKLEVNGTTQLAGNVTIKNVGGITSVIRISPAGDIGMGSFTSGTNPN